MKVLVTTPDITQPGGVANYYRVLRCHLDSGVEYFVIGVRNGSETCIEKCLRLVRDYRNFYRKVRSRDYDIVHLNPSLQSGAVLRDGLFLLMAKVYSRRVLVFFRGWDAGCERWIRSCFLSMFRLTYFKADAFIVLGSQFARSLEQFGCRKPIYVETTVVADEVFASPRCHARQTDGTASVNCFRILFLARIEKTKGIYEAIETMAILRSMVPHATMTVAGSGSELSSVRRYLDSRQLKNVQCVGYVDGRAKERMFTTANVYFLPTRHGEGMPNAVLEAMAYGLPIVIRRVGGLRDFFQDGKMGYAFDSSDPKDFAEVLQTLATDSALRARIGKYNQEYARAKFMGSHVARRLTNIYHSLMMR